MLIKLAEIVGLAIGIIMEILSFIGTSIGRSFKKRVVSWVLKYEYIQPGITPIISQKTYKHPQRL